MSHAGGRVFDSCMVIQTTLTRKKLVEVKRKAFRHRVWFTALSMVERAYIDLTIRVVDRVRSLLLAKVLTDVIKKLSDAMENKITRLMREVGYELALKLSRIAKAWGYESASQLAMDLKFIRYLTIIKINPARAYIT